MSTDVLTQLEAKPEARSNPYSWRCISRRTLANLSVRRLMFRRAVPIWQRRNLHSLNMYPPALGLQSTDAREVPTRAECLLAPPALGLADLQRPSAPSDPATPSSAGTELHTLYSPEESPSRTIAAPETSMAAESTSTMSPPLTIRRLATLGEPPAEVPLRGHIDPTHFPETAPAGAAPPYAAPCPIVDPPLPKAKAKAKAKPKAKAKAVVKTVMKAKTPSKMPSRPPEKRKFPPIRWGPCTISCGGKPGLYRLKASPSAKHTKLFTNWKSLISHLRFAK